MTNTIIRTTKGQGLVEYILILLLIVTVAILALNIAGVSIAEIFNKVLLAFRDEEPACLPYIESSDRWDPFNWKQVKGSIQKIDDQFIACPMCAGILPGYSGSDYLVGIEGVKVRNTNPTWNGYGLVFRVQEEKKGFSGYMFEVEKVNKNNPTRVYFTKWVNGAQIMPAIKMLNLPSDIDWNDPPDITVNVTGNKFVAYFDGKEVLTGKDDSYAQGGAGVIANGGTELMFSNLSLSPVDCLEANK